MKTIRKTVRPLSSNTACSLGLAALFLVSQASLFSSHADDNTDPAFNSTTDSTPATQAPQLPDRDLPDLTALLKSKRIDFTKWGNPKINATLLKLDQVQKVFDEMAKEPEIPFRYPEDGCYARAEDMAKILESQGIATVKIFIEGDLKVETPYSPKGYVQWWYHVAPAVLTEEKGKLEVMVIDPSLFDHPVTKDEWVGLMIKDDPSQTPKVYFHSRYFYTPNSSQDVDAEDGWLAADLTNTQETMTKYMAIEKQREATRIKNIESESEAVSKAVGAEHGN